MTRTFIKILITIALVPLIACNHDSGNSVITEVILPDFKRDLQEFKLSELADDVEYIKLETRNDCIVTRPRYDVSDNYILISNQYQPGQVMLFRRDGTLQALIGKEGKGPGEYIRNAPRVRISNNEEWIIVFDGASRKLLKYDLDGNFLKSVSCKELGNEDLSQFEIGPDDQIILFFRRPYEAADHLPLIKILDSQLNVVEERFFISKPKSDGVRGMAGSPSLFTRNGQIFIREPYYDTLFRKDKAAFNPLYHFKHTLNAPPSYYYQDDIYDTFIWLNLIGKFFIFHLVRIEDDSEISTCYYNLETTEFIRPKTDNTTNDMDGFGEVWVGTETVDGYIADHLQIIDLKELLQKKEYKTDVRFPEKQKQLIKLIEESDIEDNAIIRLFHVKPYRYPWE